MRQSVCLFLANNNCFKHLKVGYVVSFKEIIFANVLNSGLFFIFAFAFLGGGIKYIDEAFDEKIFSKRKALVLAPFLGIFYAFLMSLHQTAATILLAFLVGVFLAGKINNVAFYFMALFWAFFIFILGPVSISLLPFFCLVASSVIDEKGNDLSDKKQISNKYLDFWFKHRLTMDFVALGLTVLGFLELVFFFAFLAFDMGYVLVGVYSSKRLGNKPRF